MGTRKDGITLVDDVGGGGGIAVDATIVAPLPLPVSITDGIDTAQVSTHDGGALTIDSGSRVDDTPSIAPIYAIAGDNLLGDLKIPTVISHVPVNENNLGLVTRTISNPQDIAGSNTFNALNAFIEIACRPGYKSYIGEIFPIAPFTGTIQFIQRGVIESGEAFVPVFDITNNKWVYEFNFVAESPNILFIAPARNSTSLTAQATAYTSGNVTVGLVLGMSPSPQFEPSLATVVNADTVYTVNDVNSLTQTTEGRLRTQTSTKIDLTPSAPTVTSVGVASASAVAANANRKGLILRNLSNARISLGFGNAAILDSGVTLFPRDTFQMKEYDFDLAVVNAIASAAASNLAIQEYTT